MLTVASEQAIAVLLEPLLDETEEQLVCDAALAKIQPAAGGSGILHFILEHVDLAPMFFDELHDWPLLIAHRAPA